MLLDRSQDRTLTNDEVRQLLLEESELEDAEFKAIKRWNSLLSIKLWQHNTALKWMETLIPDHLVKVKAWKDGSHYILKPAHPGSVQTTHETFSFVCWLAKKPFKSVLEGLSMFDIEELVRKMESNNPIKVLLEEGFTLSLIVYKADVNL